jgi:hypothetical protein
VLRFCLSDRRGDLDAAFPAAERACLAAEADADVDLFMAVSGLAILRQARAERFSADGAAA